MKRRRILDGIAACGLILTAYGLWSWSPPLACIIVGLTVAAGAEVIGAYPRNPRGL
jgi:hypothetical protein